MKIPLSWKIKSAIFGFIRRICNHHYGCCNNITKRGGVGILCSIEDNTATVEMDYTYVVRYPLNEVKPDEV